MTDIPQQLQKLGLTLPAVAAPAGSYIAAKAHGKLLFISGQLPILDGKVIYQGKVGDDVSIEDGQKAAELCALNILAQTHSYITAHKCAVAELMKLGGFVNNHPDFTDQPKIINGASDLMAQVFGDKGQHVRFAVGAPSLPLNAAVEVEAIFALS